MRLARIAGMPTAVTAIAGNHGIALQGLSRAEKQIEVEARMLGELDDSAKVALGITVNPAPLSVDLSAYTDEDLGLMGKIFSRVAESQRPGASIMPRA